MRVAICLLAAFAAPAYAAEEPEELTEKDTAWITDAVNLLSDCSGYFEFMSAVVFANKPATREQMHQMANGAMMAASYLLYTEYHANGGEPKKLGEFSHYPEGRADANKTRLEALLEQTDREGLEAEQKRCDAAIPLQTELVQQIRNESVGR